MPRRRRSGDEPSVFDYLDYRRFLSDWYAWKKTQKRGYSYAVFARMAGFSRGVLNNVIAGRRAPSGDTLTGIQKAMGIDEAEMEFFGLLVTATLAATLEERAAALRHVFDHPQFGLAKQFDAKVIEVYSSWSAIAMAELVRLPGFSDDPAWIASRMRGRITPEEAQRALDLCLRAGVVRRNDDGTYSRQEVRIGAGMHGSYDAIRLAHLDNLELAREAMTSLPQEDRFMVSITTAASASLMPALQERLMTALRQVADQVDKTDMDGVDDGEVYIVSMHLFPLTGDPPDDDAD